MKDKSRLNSKKAIVNPRRLWSNLQC